MSAYVKNPDKTHPFTRPQFIISASHHRIELGKKTKIMGILNVTLDSFSDDGLLKRIGNDPSAHAHRALKLIQEGADIIDIGGESTRSGSKPVSLRQEIERVIPVISLLAKKTKIPISVDTYKPEVAQLALESGASIVNTIRGTQPNAALSKIVSRYRAAIVLMHMRKTPQTMQKNISYRHLIPEVIAALNKSIRKCLETGIKSDKILIDPGIGFAKTAEHNFEIIKHLAEFSILKRPILIGTSRKSFIGKIINKEPQKRIFGTATTVSACILNGAHIVRVHDVKQMRDVVNIADAIINSK